jgi:hypothetical protein
MATCSNDDQNYNNNTQFSSILDDFFDFESILPDQLLPDYNNVKQEPPVIQSTITDLSLDSNSLISSITETNKLLYNTDSNNHQFSNSCIEITKIKDNKYKHIDMPIFDELIFLNESKDSKPTVVVDDSNKKSSNINNENDQELLPWERQKRTSNILK